MQDKLLSMMINQLVEAGIEIHFHPKKLLESDDGGCVIGGFSDDDKLLELAIKRDDWFLVFAHEYCHFTQWKEGFFNDVEVIAAYASFTPWVTGSKELPPKLIEKFVRKMQWIEADNENRTLKLLKKYEVDFDRELYIQKSNVYLYSYELCRRVRKWHKKPLYEVPGLLDLVPSKKIITKEQWGKLPDGFQTLAMPCYDFNFQEEGEQ